MGINRGEIGAYCYMVKRGKPAAMIPIQERYAPEAISLIEKHELNSYTEWLSEGWKTLWIYKYPHILEVIKSVPQAPSAVFEHWLLGKLFGYEEAAIHEFIEAKPE